MIKAAFLLGGLCLTAWSAPKIVDRVERMRGGGVADLLPGDASAMIRGALPGEHHGQSPMTTRVITPRGEQMTPEEQAALLREAKARAPLPLNRPAPSKPRPGGAGSKPDGSGR